MRKKTQEQAEEEASAVGLMILEPYINCYTKIKYKCISKGHVTVKRPQHITRKAAKGCYKCYLPTLSSKYRGVSQPNNRLMQGEAGLNRLYKEIQFNARRRNLVFKLTKEQVCDLVLDNCYWCGVTPEEEGKYSFGKCLSKNVTVTKDTFDWGKFGPRIGIDRIHNDKGYIIENSVPCCWNCNSGKRDIPIQNWINYINRMRNAPIRTIESITEEMNSLAA